MPDRTFELLQQMVVQRYSKVDQLKGDADFVSLHGDPRFIALLSQLEAPAAYAALWRADVWYESKLLTAVPVENVLDQLKPLLAQGYRPFGIAVAGDAWRDAAACCFCAFPLEPAAGGEFFLTG